MTDLYKFRGLSVAAVLAFAGVSAGHAVIVTGTYLDAQWLEVSNGVYEVDASNLDAQNELYELPVEGGKWERDGSVLRSTGKYYGYIDLTQVTLGNDQVNDYWTIGYSVAGPTIDDGGDISTIGYKAKYYIYFGDSDTNSHFALSVDDASALSSSWSGEKINFHTADGNPQTNDKAFADGDTDLGKDIGNDVEARLVNGVVEMRLYYGSGTQAVSESILNGLDYYYLGTAESNPSSVDNLFVSNSFGTSDSDLKGDSIEYDTLWIQDPQNPQNNPNYVPGTADGDNIPEPNSYAIILGAFALAWVGLRRR